jgi:bacterioferritin-associated ferredoxin
MFVCICNRVRESEVTSAVRDGACTPEDTFSLLGCAPVCGKCVPHMEECMRECSRRTITD